MAFPQAIFSRAIVLRLQWILTEIEMFATGRRSLRDSTRPRVGGQPDALAFLSRSLAEGATSSLPLIIPYPQAARQA